MPELVNLQITDAEAELPPNATAMAIAEQGPPPLRWEGDCSDCTAHLTSASSTIITDPATGVSEVRWWIRAEDEELGEELLRAMRAVYAAHVAQAHP